MSGRAQAALAAFAAGLVAFPFGENSIVLAVGANLAVSIHKGHASCMGVGWCIGEGKAGGQNIHGGG